MQVFREFPNQCPANARSLLLLQEIDGVEFGVVAGNRVAQRSTTYKSKDRGFIFGNKYQSAARIELFFQLSVRDSGVRDVR